MGFKTRASLDQGDFAIGQVYSLELDRGRSEWTAFQVVGLRDDAVLCVTLNLLLTRPPTLEEAACASPLVLTHHSWKSVLQCGWLDRNYARNCADSLLGTFPLVYRPSAPSLVTGLGGIVPFGNRVRMQDRWDKLPSKVKDAYRMARESTDRLSIDFVGEGAQLERGEMELRIGPSTMDEVTMPAEVGARPNWFALGPLSAVTSLEYQGHDAGLIDYIRDTPLIEKLSWDPCGAIESLDFRQTPLREISLVCTGVRRLQLPTCCGALELRGEIENLEILASRDGAGIRLDVESTEARLDRIHGLSKIRYASFGRFREFDCAEVVRFRSLRELWLHNIGHLEGLGRLDEISSLRSLVLINLYDMDASSIPTPRMLPSLTNVDADGLRGTDAVLIQERLAGLKGLVIHGADDT